MFKSAGARRIARLVLGNILALLLLLAVLEGVSGYVILTYRLFTFEPPAAELVHSEYDSEIGWINRSSVRMADRWGPGAHLTINSQRFRGLTDVVPSMPPGRVRLVCSGDSFTFGLGVGDEQTWCHRLAAMDDRIEALNWGAGGWGIDQAYLWYQRNQRTYRHDVHLFAFITHDFHRATLDSFRGYGKPHLTLRDDALVQENYPVSRSGYYLPRLANAQGLLTELATFDLLNRASRRLGAGDSTDEHEIRAIVSRIFRELDRAAQADARLLVIVHLPIFDDYIRDRRWGDTEAWGAFVEEEAQQHGYRFIDVVAEQRKIPFDGIRDHYRLQSDGHYSIEGHRWVADIIYRKLMEYPEVVAKLR